MTAMPCGPATGIAGPAILEEREATTVIPPGDRLAVDDGLNLSITIGEGQKQIALVTPGTPRAEAVARLSVDPIDAPFGASQLAVYRRFAPPEPTRDLVLAWRRSFPRGDALQGFARGLREALASKVAANRSARS